MEEWKDIKGYEGLYQVSNEGRVKSLDHTIVCDNGKGVATKKQKGKILRSFSRKLTYQTVGLSKGGKEKHYQVHRLVAEAFIDNPDNLPCVNHKDENPSNNVWTNLEWCTHQYNMNYGTCQQRKSEKMKGKTKKVYQYTLNGELVGKYVSVEEASRKNNVSVWGIYSVCSGKQKAAYGYIWLYNDINH